VVLNAPGRDTPEKDLQSWLISEAMQNKGRVASIERALNDHHSYWLSRTRLRSKIQRLGSDLSLTYFSFARVAAGSSNL
jgi:hypothetical protein